MKTIPDVFIIESLNPGDEGNGRFEGSVVSHTLRLHDKRPICNYVRTRKQFQKAVLRFGESNYRYLHISAHANSEGMCTTNQDEIDYRTFAEIVAPHMSKKRLFLSACSMAKKKLAEKIIPQSDCYSVVGPRRKVSFSSTCSKTAKLFVLKTPHIQSSSQFANFASSYCAIIGAV